MPRLVKMEGLHTAKEDAASSIVTVESAFITGVIEAHADREVAGFCLPRAFLNAKNDENVIVCMKEKLAEMMMMIASQVYSKFI